MVYFDYLKINLIKLTKYIYFLPQTKLPKFAETSSECSPTFLSAFSRNHDFMLQEKLKEN